MASAIETNSRKWRGIRSRVLKRDGGRCVVCKATATEVDHVVPRQLGGGDTWDNLQAMCSACHRRKSEYDRRRILELVAHVARVGVAPVADAGAVLRASGHSNT